MLGILYLTKNCNFKCSYCYEKNKHVNETISLDLINQTVDYYLQNESNQPSIIYFFGGEPFLAFDKIIYTYDLCLKMKKKFNKDFVFGTITNGSLIHKYIPELKKMLVTDKKFFFELLISYDGIFQYRRTKSDIVQQNLELLKKEGIPFGISYTVTKENMNLRVLLNDLLLIIKKYFLNTTNTNSKIRLNFNQKDIELSGSNFQKYISTLKKYLEYFYFKYNISFCHIICDVCQKCENVEIETGDKKSKSKEKIAYIIPGEKDILVNDAFQKKEFNHF